MRLLDLFGPRKENRELRQELDQLKRRVDALDEEWSDYYDRFRRMMAKMAKRQEREQQNEVREDAPREGVVEAPETSLTPSQMLIQQKILSRRNRLRAVGG